MLVAALGVGRLQLYCIVAACTRTPNALARGHCFADFCLMHPLTCARGNPEPVAVLQVTLLSDAVLTFPDGFSKSGDLDNGAAASCLSTFLFCPVPRVPADV